MISPFQAPKEHDDQHQDWPAWDCRIRNEQIGTQLSSPWRVRGIAGGGGTRMMGVTHAHSRRPWSRGEEIANSVSHGIGLLAALIAVPLLLAEAVRRGDAQSVARASVFGITILLLYLTSTLFHALPDGRANRIFEVLDNAAVFLLIAGTYTPLTLGLLRGVWGLSLFGVVWTLAAAGVVLIVVGDLRYPVISASLCLGMGWLCLIALRPLARTMPVPGLLLVLAGGLAYTAGLAFWASGGCVTTISSGTCSFLSGRAATSSRSSGMRSDPAHQRTDRGTRGQKGLTSECLKPLGSKNRGLIQQLDLARHKIWDLKMRQEIFKISQISQNTRISCLSLTGFRGPRLGVGRALNATVCPTCLSKQADSRPFGLVVCLSADGDLSGTSRFAPGLPLASGCLESGDRRLLVLVYVGEDVGHALEGRSPPTTDSRLFLGKDKTSMGEPRCSGRTPRPLPLAVSAGALLTARAMELLPPPPGVKGHIGPENEHAPEDRHDPAVPGVAREREGLARRPLD